MNPAPAATVGLWGQFDVDRFDTQIRLRVTRHELQRRLPDATVRAFAPFGAQRPIAVAASEAVEALTPVTDARRSELDECLDLIVLVGTVDEHERYDSYPPADPNDVESAYALMRDPPSSPSAVTDPRDEHPGVVANRVWTYAACAQRRSFLVAMQWWPSDGAAVVIDARSTPTAEINAAVAQTSAGTACVCINTIDTDELPDGVLRVPADRSSIEDRVAAIAGARRVIANDPAVLAVAFAYGVHTETTDSPAARSTRVATVDTAFDAIAATVTASPRRVTDDAEVVALRAALRAHQQRLAHERVVFADYVRAVRSIAAQQVADAQHARTLFDKLAARVPGRTQRP